MKVFVVDDHAGFRRVARSTLQLAGHDVVGEAEGLADALSGVASAEPDVVFVDVCLADGDGFDLADALATASPAATCVMISTHPEAVYAARLRSSPAAGFISKGEFAVAGPSFLSHDQA